METTTYDKEAQGSAMGLLVAAGISIGILIIIIVIMNVVGLQTYIAAKPIWEATATASDGNFVLFRQSAYTSVGSGFSSMGTLGNFVPIIVIVSVAAIVLALLGGFGGTATGQSQGL